MSAFQCSTEHVGAVVRAFLDYGRDMLPAQYVNADVAPEVSRDLGTALAALNASAVASRYGEPPVCVGFDPAAIPFSVAPGRALKLVQVLAYQCGEGEMCEAHPLYRAMKRLAECLSFGIIRGIVMRHGQGDEVDSGVQCEAYRATAWGV